MAVLNFLGGREHVRVEIYMAPPGHNPQEPGESDLRSAILSGRKNRDIGMVVGRAGERNPPS